MNQGKDNSPNLIRIFGVFAKIGAFTIGGGYAMIPLIEAEMRHRNWIGEDEMPDIVVLAQSAPGLLAVNMAIYAGHRLRGIPGSIAATLGAVLPSFIAILLIAMVFTSFKDNPVVQRIFQGVRPVAVALILVPMVNMARKSSRRWWSWLLMGGTLIGVAFLKFSPIWIILTVIACSVGLSFVQEARSRK